jgi:Rha family phage regulatory protein
MERTMSYWGSKMNLTEKAVSEFNETINGVEVKFDISESGFSVSSRDIASVFEKRHADVIRAIENIDRFEKLMTKRKILLSEYRDKSGKSNKAYQLDRDVFSKVAFGFNGKKADDWQWAYIDAFNKMEAMLKEPTDTKQLEERNEQLEKQIQATSRELIIQTEIFKQKENHLMKVASLGYLVQASPDSIDTNTFVKMLLKEDGIDIGNNRFLKWLRERKYTIKNGVPSQQMADDGFLEQKIKDRYLQVLITPAGVKRFSRELIALHAVERKIAEQYNQLVFSF